MKEICKLNYCTGCNACKNFCPKKAITMEYNKYDTYYPVIDEKKCINCGLCQKVCHNNNKELEFNIPQKVYASWDSDKEKRLKSASGGICSCLHKYAIENDIITYGVFWKKEYELEFKKIESIKDLDNARNSKYLYSNTKEIYVEIKKHLENGKKVLFTGVPCQVAGLKTALRKEYKNLITVDLVCHGMPSNKYFEKHMEYIKKKNKIDKIEKLRFRTNNNYNMIIEADNNKKVILEKEKDPYLVGFHKSIIHRESCYDCRYARKERISDITLCDFWGLKDDKELKTEVKNGISGVLINTDKGKEFFDNIKPQIFYTERTLEKICKNNEQLNNPARKTKEREKFLNLYEQYGFEKSIKKTIRKNVIIDNIKKAPTVKKLKGMIPRKIKDKIKTFV